MATTGIFRARQVAIFWSGAEPVHTPFCEIKRVMCGTSLGQKKYFLQLNLIRIIIINAIRKNIRIIFHPKIARELAVHMTLRLRAKSVR